jgi:hypothetical protein
MEQAHHDYIRHSLVIDWLGTDVFWFSHTQWWGVLGDFIGLLYTDAFSINRLGEVQTQATR